MSKEVMTGEVKSVDEILAEELKNNLGKLDYTTRQALMMIFKALGEGKDQDEYLPEVNAYLEANGKKPIPKMEKRGA